MASGELKYWVFHEETLDEVLAAYVGRFEPGHVQDVARMEADQVKRFLLSSDAKKLQGGRAG